MNRRVLAGVVFAVVALAGSVVVASLMAGCENMGCMMGSMGGSSHSGTEKPGAPIVNARCPIMGGKPVTSLTRDYKGQTVGFCCGMCPGQWDKLPDAEKDAKLAKVVAGGK